MNRKQVPVKTNEGALEIKQRVLGLAPRIRTALLLVDGVRSADELERMMTAAGVTPGALQLLLDMGLIRFPVEVLAEKQAAAKVDAVPAPPIAAAAAPASAPAPKAVNVPPPVAASAAVGREPGRDVASARPHAAAPGPSTDLKRMGSSVLTVAPLLEVESILGVATELEVDTILNVASKLEVTPTQMLAPDTAVKAPVTETVHLPPLAEAERAFKLAATDRKPAAPAAISRMNLMVARAHIANALDQFLEIDGYGLKLSIIACESADELEQLFRQVESGLIQKLDKYAIARVMGIARALLAR